MHTLEVEVRILAEVSGVFSLDVEDGEELVSRPLDAVVNQVRETLESAHGDGVSIFRKRSLTVGLSLMRNDGFVGSYDSEGARLNDHLVEPVGFSVNVSSGLVVVHSKDDEVLALPEVVIKDMLSPAPD